MTIDENSLEVEYKHPENEHPRTPQEIAAYVREEHTPYANSTSIEEADKHLADMIQRLVDYEVQRYKNSIELP